MNKITIKIEYNNLDNKNLLEYLLNLKGINNIQNNKEEDEYITIEYTKDITITIIVKEILLFLNIKIPSINFFDKHEENNLEKYTIIIKDLCCEYCLNGMIEELLYIEGINKAYSDYDNINKKDIKINIYYDKNKITKEELIKIEKEFNN